MPSSGHCPLCSSCRRHLVWLHDAGCLQLHWRCHVTHLQSPPSQSFPAPPRGTPSLDTIFRAAGQRSLRSRLPCGGRAVMIKARWRGEGQTNNAVGHHPLTVVHPK
ncbi:hypothetical protein CGRA01v4_09244 [Colletotrichum graminicola]|nr:hypothetical protein CGRA01v4_09244 [Colletotrichum graminicola]